MAAKMPPKDQGPKYGIMSRPYVASGKIFVGSADGKVYKGVINKHGEVERWEEIKDGR